MPIRPLPALGLAGLLDAATGPLWTWATPLPPAVSIVLLLLPDASALRCALAGLWVDALLGTWGLHAAAGSTLYAAEYRCARIPILSAGPVRVLFGALATAAVVPAWNWLAGRSAGLSPGFFALQFLFLVVLTDRPRRELSAA